MPHFWKHAPHMESIHNAHIVGLVVVEILVDPPGEAGHALGLAKVRGRHERRPRTDLLPPGLEPLPGKTGKHHCTFVY